MRPNQTVQPTGASRLAQRRIERQRRLAPVADLAVSRMLRTAKSIAALNFVSSMVLVGIYLTYGLSGGLHLDSQFLGVGHSSKNYYAWILPAFLELQLVGCYVFQRFSDEPTTLRHGGVYILWGTLGLLMALRFGQGLDRVVGLYVWSSDILYGVSLAKGD